MGLGVEPGTVTLLLGGKTRGDGMVRVLLCIPEISPPHQCLLGHLKWSKLNCQQQNVTYKMQLLS